MVYKKVAPYEPSFLGLATIPLPSDHFGPILKKRTQRPNHSNLIPPQHFFYQMLACPRDNGRKFRFF